MSLVSCCSCFMAQCVATGWYCKIRGGFKWPHLLCAYVWTHTQVLICSIKCLLKIIVRLLSSNQQNKHIPKMWEHKEPWSFRSMCAQCMLARCSLQQACLCWAGGRRGMLLGAGLGTRQLNLKAWSPLPWDKGPRHRMGCSPLWRNVLSG